jgi:hypothetical protein
VSGTVTGSVTSLSTEELVVDAGAGADTMTVQDLTGSVTNKVTLNAGKISQPTNQLVTVTTPSGETFTAPLVNVFNDGATDTITLVGRNSADTFTLQSADALNGVMQDIHVVQVSGTDFTIVNTVRNGSEADTLVIDALGGDDTLDASGMGPGAAATAVFPDLAVIVLQGGEGNDRLIGTPFADTLNGGNGSDTYTGGAGYDTFIDSSPAADTDTLIETNDSDMGLYGNLFIVGVIYADNGTTLYATGAGNVISSQDMIDQIKGTTIDHIDNNHNGLVDEPGEDDPNFRTTGWGDQYSAASVAETITGIFEVAILTGGDHNNTLVVNDTDGIIYVGGAARTVTQ